MTTIWHALIMAGLVVLPATLAVVLWGMAFWAAVFKHEGIR